MTQIALKLLYLDGPFPFQCNHTILRLYDLQADLNSSLVPRVSALCQIW